MVDLKNENKMSVPELKAEIERMILENFRVGAKISDIEARRKYFKKLRLLVGLEKIIGKHQVRVIKDANSTIDFESPRLYTCTVGGENDLKTIFSLINKPAWMPVSNPEYHGDFETFLFRNHFITWYDSLNEEMKTALLDRHRKTLLSGEDLVCFPETQPLKTGEVSELNPEYADIIVDTSPVIIPVGILEYRYGDMTTSYVNIGKYFDLKGLKKVHQEDILTIISDELNRLKRDTRSYVESRMERNGVNGVINDGKTEDIGRHLLIKR